MAKRRKPKTLGTCIVCDEPVLEQSHTEIYSSFCGSIHPACCAEHARGCEICRKDFLDRGSITPDELEDTAQAGDYGADENGNLLYPGTSLPVYCDGESCEAPAKHAVAVSVNAAHDEVRTYCESHYEAYIVGVQHGRYHEAARHGGIPGRDSSQEPPEVIHE